MAWSIDLTDFDHNQLAASLTQQSSSGVPRFSAALKANTARL